MEPRGTASSSLGIARRVLEGDFAPGFQTPAKQYCADFVLELAGGSHRERAGDLVIDDVLAVEAPRGVDKEALTIAASQHG